MRNQNRSVLAAFALTALVGACTDLPDEPVPQSTEMAVSLTPLTATSYRFEAETMSLSGYVRVPSDAASGSAYVATHTRGTIGTTFTGAAGTYNIIITYFDESDGNATFTVSIAGKTDPTWTWTANDTRGPAVPERNNRLTKTITATLAAGNQIQITGVANLGEEAAVDMVEIAPPVQTAPVFTKYRSRASDDLRGVAYGASRFVAVGKDGAVRVSTDGIIWTSATTRPTGDVSSVIFASSKFYAVAIIPGAVSGSIYSSTDGLTWTLVQAGVCPGKLLTANGVYFLSHHPTNEFPFAVYKSSDLKTWTAGMPMPGEDDTLGAIAFGAGVYVGVGSGSEDYTVIDYSTDGITWTAATLDNQMGTMNDVVFASGKFVSVGINGDTFWSADGKAWTYVAVPGASDAFSLSSLIYNSKGTHPGFQAVSDQGQTFVSSNGASWTALGTAGVARGLTDVATSGTLTVAVGTSGVILRSSDMVTWTTSVAASALDVALMAFGGSLFAAGETTFFSSPDALTWTTRTTIAPVWASQIRYLNGAFYAPAIVYGTTDSTTPGQLLKSTSGTAWSVQYNSPEWVTDIAASATTYVMVSGAGTVRWSTDAKSWTSATVPLQGMNLTSVIYANGRFLAMADNGMSILSADGKAWMYGRAPFEGAQSLAAGAGLFAALGDYGDSIYTSYDGIIWDKRASMAGVSGKSIAFVNGRFLAVGGAIQTSENGLTWKACTSDSVAQLLSISYGASKYVVGGESGTILTGK